MSELYRMAEEARRQIAAGEVEDGGFAVFEKPEDDPTTTPINDDKFIPLDVGWTSLIGTVRQADGTFKRVRRYKVSLSMPASPYRRRMPLVNMSAGTALNLLKWLEQRRDILERLAREEGVL